MNSGLKNNKGFSLIELLIYLAVFAMSASLMVSALSVFLKVGQRESAGSEVSSQLNFVMQTIQRLVKESSNIDIAADTATSTLKLRMKNQANDPTCISLVNGIIRLAEGPAENPNECSSDFSTLTSDRIIVDNLEFTKLSQYPGHDVVSIDIQMTYDSQNPESREQRTLRSAIARVSAATFDSDLLPGADNQYEVGFSQDKRWKNISISNLLNLGQSAGEPVGGQNGSIYYNSTENKFKGYQSGQWSDLGGGGAWQALGDNIYNSNVGGVGIGTNNPLGPFHIAVASSSNVFVVDALGNIGIGTSAPVGTFHIANASSSSAFVVDAFGNVGIGTSTPITKLDIRGDLSVQLKYAYFMSFGGTPGWLTPRCSCDTTQDNVDCSQNFWTDIDEGATCYDQKVGGYSEIFNRNDNNPGISSLSVIKNSGKVVAGMGLFAPRGNVGIGNMNPAQSFNSKLYIADFDNEAYTNPEGPALKNENNLVSIVLDNFYTYPDNLLKIAIDPYGWNYPDYPLVVNSSGQIGMGTSTPNGNWRLDVRGPSGGILVNKGDWGGSAGILIEKGNLAITQQGDGIVLKATDNPAVCYKITVDSAGTLSTASEACPTP